MPAGNTKNAATSNLVTLPGGQVVDAATLTDGSGGNGGGKTTLPGGQVVNSSTVTTGAGGGASPGDYANPFGPGSSAYNLAGNTANSNLAAMGSLIQESNIINAQNAAQQKMLNDSRLGPQGVDTQNALLDNANREAKGLLDSSTEQMLQQGIAAEGNANGMGVDSANLAAAYRRALGLDINATEQQGQTNYLGLLAANPSAPLYDVSKGMVSPDTYASTAEAIMAFLKKNGGGGGGGGTTPGGGGGTTRMVGGANPLGRSPAEANGGAGSGNYSKGGIVTQPGETWSPDTYSTYYPGGSSVYGLIDIGGGNFIDPQDPSGGLAQQFGQVRNYSDPGYDPIAAALGLGLTTGNTYDPTNTNYGNNYWTPYKWAGTDLGFNYDTNLLNDLGGYTGSGMTDTSGWGSSTGTSTSTGTDYSWLNDPGVLDTWLYGGE